MIVECPGCQSRYDVTGRPPGTRARCRCGTIFVLPDPPSTAATLDCPRCGGNVAATNHDCEYCGAHLLVKACPRCFSRIFEGAKHCATCGANVVVPAHAKPDGTAAPRLCPRCEKNLQGTLIGDVLLDECPGCYGVWVDVPALERIVNERAQARAEAIFGHAGPPDDSFLQQPQGPVYIRCPDCETVMNRRQFAPGSGVLIDVCRPHGTWFDARELPRVVQFVMDGGLERAQRTELDRQREQVRREKSATLMAIEPASSHGDSSGLIGVVLDVIADFVFWK